MEPAQVMTSNVSQGAQATMWEPCTKNPPAPGYHWVTEFLGEDYRSGVIYWVRKDDR